MAKDVQILDAVGRAIPPTVGGLLGLIISNKMASYLYKSLPEQWKDRDKVSSIVADYSIGYIGYLITINYDKPFITGEIWGAGVGMACVVLGRGILRTLIALNIIDRKKYYYLGGWSSAFYGESTQ